MYVPLLTLIVALLAWRREFRLALFVTVTVAGSSLLSSTVRALVGRDRPAFADPVAHAGASSFPGGLLSMLEGRRGSSP